MPYNEKDCSLETFCLRTNMVLAAVDIARAGGDCTQIDRTLQAVGLPSTETLMVSEENIVKWTMGAAKEVIHRLNIWVNKAYATLTNADDRVKAEIAAAEKEGRDHDRYVPIPKVHMVAGIAAIVAATVGLVKLTKNIKRIASDIKAGQDTIREHNEYAENPASPQARARAKMYDEARRARNAKVGDRDKNLVKELWKKGSARDKELILAQRGLNASPAELKELETRLAEFKAALKTATSAVNSATTPEQAKAASQAVSEMKLLTHHAVQGVSDALSRKGA